MSQKENAGSQTNVDKRKKRNDIFLIVVFLAVALVVGGVYYFSREEGETVIVTVNGEPFGTYSLREDLTVEIPTGNDKENRNCLVIRDGKAFVSEANCPDGICVSHKPIFRDGESIVCLPHRVVIFVQSETEREEADIIA